MDSINKMVHLNSCVVIFRCSSTNSHNAHMSRRPVERFFFFVFLFSKNNKINSHIAAAFTLWVTQYDKVNRKSLKLSASSCNSHALRDYPNISFRLFCYFSKKKKKKLINQIVFTFRLREQKTGRQTHISWQINHMLKRCEL